MKLKFFICLMALLLLAQPALAFDKLFNKYCKGSKVPPELAKAIARQESDMKPLCINVAGKDFWPTTREEAVAIIKKAQEQKKSYDVGLMQINSQWIKAWGIEAASLLDPETNIRYGVRILREEIDRHGLNWRAVGGYHSPNPIRGFYYAGMVSRHLKGNPELKSKMSNPRLAGSFGRLRQRFTLPPMNMNQGDIPGQSHVQRKPVGFEHASNDLLFKPRHMGRKHRTRR